MDKKLISVIVITYNHEKYIRRCLDSIVQQSLPDFCNMEILIGNDASTDSTAEIINEFSQHHCKIAKPYHRQTNMGATYNLKNLFKKAQGHYFAICEGDDYWSDSNKLLKQFNFLENNSDYIACTHDCIIVDEDNNIISSLNPSWVSNKRIFTKKDIDGYSMPGHTSTFFFRYSTEFMSDTGLDTLTLDPLISDRAIGMFLASLGKIYHFPESMSCYRKIYRNGANNASSQKYASNENKEWDDYLYSKKLQHHLNKVMMFDVDFSPHIKYIVQLLAFKCIKTMKPLHWKHLIAILHKERKFKYISCIFNGLITKLLYRLRKM